MSGEPPLTFLPEHYVHCNYDYEQHVKQYLDSESDTYKKELKSMFLKIGFEIYCNMENFSHDGAIQALDLLHSRADGLTTFGLSLDLERFRAQLVKFRDNYKVSFAMSEQLSQQIASVHQFSPACTCDGTASLAADEEGNCPSINLRCRLRQALVRYWVDQLVLFYQDPFHYGSQARSVLKKTKDYRTKAMISVSLLQGGVEMNPGPNGQKRIRRRPRNRRRGARQQQIVAAQGNKMPGTRNMSIAVSRPRRFERGMPSNYYIRLSYVIPLQQVLGGGTTNSLKFTTNAYDVDSALASTAMAYFTELAAIYSRFRTLGLHYRFTVNNSEAFPIQIIHGFSTVSFSATALGANYAENRFLKQDILSNVNGSRSSRVFSGHIRTRDLFGTIQCETDDLFTGSTTSSTLGSTSTGYMYIGGVSAAIPVSGWFVSGTIALDVEFFRRNDIIS
jgi:hypothetical protein